MSFIQHVTNVVSDCQDLGIDFEPDVLLTRFMETLDDDSKP
jgi:hypothetical protein